jgi:peroxiredoxin Q/BCP
MAAELTIGKKAPAFTMPTDGDGKIALKELKGQNVILYFYPKDMTPGCTTESVGFSENAASFKKAGAVIIGVSKDSVARHDKFKAKHDLNLILASDEETEICEKYGVWAQKSMFGKKYMGIVRSTFLIDGDGKIQQIWKKVKVKGHVDEVLEATKNL